MVCSSSCDDYGASNDLFHLLRSLIIVVPIFLLQLIHVRVYGEMEFWLSTIKVVLIVMFIMWVSLHCTCSYLVNTDLDISLALD